MALLKLLNSKASFCLSVPAVSGSFGFGLERRGHTRPREILVRVLRVRLQ